MLVDRRTEQLVAGGTLGQSRPAPGGQHLGVHLLQRRDVLTPVHHWIPQDQLIDRGPFCGGERGEGCAVSNADGRDLFRRQIRTSVLLPPT